MRLKHYLNYIISCHNLLISLFVILQVSNVTQVAAEFVENEVIGQPNINCNADTIDMQFRTKRQFSGKVYVKGSYSKPECRVDYSLKSADGRPKGGIRLNHGACNMDRQRMITPEGMMFSTVLIISFHPLFITRMDKAYHIKCMYREAARTVTAALDVSNLPTEAVQSDLPMPVCTYTIRSDQLDGPILKYARVGDQVVHRWQCDSEEYGLLVHSCYVEDGQGEKQLIIDERGCHTDHLLLGDPTYVEALNMAYRESFVFKFADRVAVRFQCEIRLCLKEDAGCEGITPPLCNSGMEHNPDPYHLQDQGDLSIVGSNTSATNTTDNRESRRWRRSHPTFRPKDADLYSQTVYVLDGAQEGNKDEGALPLTNDPPPNRICLGPTGLAWIASFLVLALISVISVVAYIIHRKLYRISLPIEKRTNRGLFY